MMEKVIIILALVSHLTIARSNAMTVDWVGSEETSFAQIFCSVSDSRLHVLLQDDVQSILLLLRQYDHHSFVDQFTWYLEFKCSCRSIVTHIDKIIVSDYCDKGLMQNAGLLRLRIVAFVMKLEQKVAAEIYVEDEQENQQQDRCVLAPSDDSDSKLGLNNEENFSFFSDGPGSVYYSRNSNVAD
jgi:hypothetical protein